MEQKYTLEICVESVEAAMAAERGGADRIELCSELNVGGITPGTELMLAAREQLNIPIFKMIRPRGGDFVYSAGDFARMKHEVEAAKKFGMDGLVLGILTAERKVDVVRTRELVELARPLPVTFHRAFDECADLFGALEDVIQTGAARILTSGGALRASGGGTTLGKLVAAAGSRIVILPGAGINASNITLIVQQTKSREFHTGLGSELPYGSRDYDKFETEVRKLAKQLARLA